MYVEVKFTDLDETYKKVLSASIVENTLVDDASAYAYIKLTREYLETNEEQLMAFLNNPTAFKVEVATYSATPVTTPYMEVVSMMSDGNPDRRIESPNCEHPLAIIRSGTSSLFAHL